MTAGGSGPSTSGDDRFVAPRPWFVYLVVTWSITFVAQFTSLPQPPLFGAVVVSSLVVVVIGVNRYQRGWQPLWQWFVAGFALYALASVTWAVWDPVGTEQLVPVGIHTLGFAFLLAAMVRIVRHRNPGGDRAGLIDALIATVAAVVFGWTLVLEPIAADMTAEPVERIVVVAYPLMDLAMIPLLVQLALGSGGRTVALRSLLVALAAAVLANFTYAYRFWHGLSTDWLSLIYPLGFALVASATLHPSLARLDSPLRDPDDVTTARRGDRPVSRLRFAIVAALSLAVPTLALFQHARGSAVDLPVVMGGAIVLFGLVAARMWGLVKDVEVLTARRGEERFRALVDNADDVILVLDPQGRVAYVTPSIERWGYGSADIEGSLWSEKVHADDAAAWHDSIAMVARSGKRAVNLHCRVCTPEGGWLEVDVIMSDLSHDPHVRGVVATLHDVTDRHRLERQLAHQAQHDPLTGLPNRTLFLQRIEAACRADARGAAVLFVDIDDFKGFNDGLGHAAGDELLRCVSERVLHAIRTHDVAARLGGDEFAVLLSIEDPAEAAAVGSRVLHTIQTPMTIADRQIVVRASVGVATGAPDVRAEDLLKHADTAMYAAKSRGKAQLQAYDPRMLEQETRRRAIVAELPNATSGQTSLVYQPIVSLEDASVLGVEALLRWRHPELEIVGPLEFIPLAEESGLIIPIGRWVLSTACAQAASWFAAAAGSRRHFYVTVNLSVVQLRDDQLVDDVATALEDSGLPPAALVLEVTESVLAADETAARLQQLRDLGVRIAVDDFGTGYSSLRYLQRFPLDVIKIDRAFVEALDRDPTLARAIIGLADALNLSTVAEGIETRRQADVLRQLGCEMGQGYFYARPLPASDARAFLLPAAAG